MDYPEMLITKFDDVQHTEGYINQWNKHLVLAVKRLFKFKYRLCNTIFKKIGSNVEMGYFSKIASHLKFFIFSNLGSHQVLEAIRHVWFFEQSEIGFQSPFWCGRLHWNPRSTRALIKRIFTSLWDFWATSSLGGIAKAKLLLL